MSERQPARGVSLDATKKKLSVSEERQQRIVDLFRIPDRYRRSTHLEQDFADCNALKNYIVTPATIKLFCRLINDITADTGQRAWRITGDFGTGKSSFALALARLLHNPMEPTLGNIWEPLKHHLEPDLLSTFRMVPVLVTGSREPLVPAVARGIRLALERMNNQQEEDKLTRHLLATARDVEVSSNPSLVPDLFENLSCFAVNRGLSGVLLVIDELGKFLEYAAFHRDQEDVHILQILAECATRSRDKPLAILALLHQYIHVYASGLPSTTRLEWEKVAGRFEEMKFDQPLSHVVALMSGTLNIDKTTIPESVLTSVHRVLESTTKTGWYGPKSKDLSPLDLYPLHPTVLPVLVQFFARFGQHERSLYGFLLSSEPYGLLAFAERVAGGKSWYRIPDFYDYVHCTFGGQLAAVSYRGNWLRISGTIERLSDLSALELDILKTVALLNALDLEYLLATDYVILAALSDGNPNGTVKCIVEGLKQRGLLFNRGTAGGYRLWPSTSVDLESKLEEAKRVLGPMDLVSTHLVSFLEKTSVVARRHYIETGTLRHFEVCYVDSGNLLETVKRPIEADGLVVVVLSNTPVERRDAVTIAESTEIADYPRVLVAIPPHLQGVSAEVMDARCWQWVADNTHELTLDPYAAREVAYQIAKSVKLLRKRLRFLAGLGNRLPSGSDWWHAGKCIDITRKKGLSGTVSEICDVLYCDAPLVKNELINRDYLSTAAAAARRRLFELMFSAAEKECLGIEPNKMPPEKSIYLSVLAEGNVHRKEKGQFVISEPPNIDDRLRLRPALNKILSLLEEAEGHRVSVARIFDVLRRPPLGVRSGLAPLLLSVQILANPQEIAIYENGTFLHQFGAHDFFRLTKRSQIFEIQSCRVVGAQKGIFRLLVDAFAETSTIKRNLDLLDVVRPLSIFAARLPEYTRQHSDLSMRERSVRDAILKAREPAKLLFEDLPVACGLKPFTLDGPTENDQEQEFITRLEKSVSLLAETYPKLLGIIRATVIQTLDMGTLKPDRDHVAKRVSRVIPATRENRLRTFIRCLADTSLSDDAWAERIGSFVAAKPPNRWTREDEKQALGEIGELTAIFGRVETTIIQGMVDGPYTSALRLGLTNSDGSEEATIVRFHEQDESVVQALAAKVEQVLAERSELKVAVISHVAWQHLTGKSGDFRKLPDGTDAPPGSSKAGPK